MKKAISIGVITLFLVAVALIAAAFMPTPAKPTSIQALFACASGKSIDATFSDNQAKIALSDGRTYILPQTISGSGARYANKDESVVFWNKGNTAFIEENGKTTYDGCATASAQ